MSPRNPQSGSSNLKTPTAQNPTINPSTETGRTSSTLLQETPRGCRLQVLVQPGASNDAVVGVLDGALKLRISAPPVEGAANERCQLFLAKTVLGVPKSRVVLVSGDKSRHKCFEILGFSGQELMARLEVLREG